MGGKILFLASLARKRLEGQREIASKKSNKTLSLQIFSYRVNYENISQNCITTNLWFLRNFDITNF